MNTTDRTPFSHSDDADRAASADRYAEGVAGGRARFAEFLASVRTLVQMFRAYRAGEFAMSVTEVLMLVGALLYVVNPVDAMPEAILGPAGLPDDVAAVVAAVAGLAAAILRFRKRQAA